MHAASPPIKGRHTFLAWAGLVLCLAWHAHADTQPGKRSSKRLPGLPSQPLPPEQQLANAQLCSQDTTLTPLLANIEHSLRFWAPPPGASTSTAPLITTLPNTTAAGSPTTSTPDDPTPSWGITPDLVDAAIANNDSRWAWRRVAVLFEGGKAFVISDPEWPRDAGHHRMLVAAHVMLMVGLSRLYGAALPDVELVLGTSDEPTIRLDHTAPGQRPLPLLRFCTTQHHADILVPDIHFHMRSFTANMLSLAAGNTSDGTWLPPWSERSKRLFGRFSPYNRIHHLGDNSTSRKGFRGAELCEITQGSSITALCPVRTAFMEWAERKRVHEGVRLDVAPQPRRTMPHHARYKYLLHLDGQTCSSRLEQLLALGSLTLKEESGYHAFYHHLLKPYKHYVPFWKEVPEEVLGALDWARTHDQEAEAIAAAGQQLALAFLNKQALRCYWLRVIQAYARLQRYRPGLAGGRQYTWHTPAEEWLSQGQGRAFVRNFRLSMEV